MKTTTILFVLLVLLPSTAFSKETERKKITIEYAEPTDGGRISEDPKADFHWTDEKDPAEREWLKDNWDLK